MYVQKGEAHYTTADELDFINYLVSRQNLTCLRNLRELVPYRIWYTRGLDVDPAAVANALDYAIRTLEMRHYRERQMQTHPAIRLEGSPVQ